MVNESQRKSTNVNDSQLSNQRHKDQQELLSMSDCSTETNTSQREHQQHFVSVLSEEPKVFNQVDISQWNSALLEEYSCVDGTFIQINGNQCIHRKLGSQRESTQVNLEYMREGGGPQQGPSCHYIHSLSNSLFFCFCLSFFFFVLRCSIFGYKQYILKESGQLRQTSR